MAESVLMTWRLGRQWGPRWAARAVDLDIRRGEVYGFIGQNGAGKTTVLRMVAGLLRPSEGRVTFDGRHRPALGFLPQSARFSEDATAVQVIAFHARLRGADGAPALERARRFDLELRRPVRLLSPGQQRKLQIVVATVGEPRLLLLDEPTAGLDPLGIVQFRSLARECAREGRAVVVSSHALAELDRLCSRVGIIDGGRLLYQGPAPSRVRFETSPLDPETLLELGRHAGRAVSPDRDGLLLEIPRESVPDTVRLLSRRGIDVFGVREEGLESFFRETLTRSGATGVRP